MDSEAPILIAKRAREKAALCAMCVMRAAPWAAQRLPSCRFRCRIRHVAACASEVHEEDCGLRTVGKWVRCARLESRRRRVDREFQHVEVKRLCSSTCLHDPGKNADCASFGLYWPSQRPCLDRSGLHRSRQGGRCFKRGSERRIQGWRVGIPVCGPARSGTAARQAVFRIRIIGIGVAASCAPDSAGIDGSGAPGDQPGNGRPPDGHSGRIRKPLPALGGGIRTGPSRACPGLCTRIIAGQPCHARAPDGGAPDCSRTSTRACLCPGRGQGGCSLAGTGARYGSFPIGGESATSLTGRCAAGGKSARCARSADRSRG